MNKNVYKVLEAYWTQHHSAKLNFYSSRWCSGGKQLQNHRKVNESSKPTKLLKDKQLVLSKKLKIFLFYEALWRRFVNPLVESFSPRILKNEEQLSKLCDFRSHSGFKHSAEYTDTGVCEVYSKCSEEPKPISINTIVKEENMKRSRNVWEDKNRNMYFRKDSRNYNALSKKKKKSVLYNLFVAKVVEPKVERLMPNIHDKNISQFCDFRINLDTPNIECGQLPEIKIHANEGKEKPAVKLYTKEQQSNLNKEKIKRTEIPDQFLSKTNALQTKVSEKTPGNVSGLINSQSDKKITFGGRTSGKVNSTTDTVNNVTVTEDSKMSQANVLSNIPLSVKPPSNLNLHAAKILEKGKLNEDILKRLNKVNDSMSVKNVKQNKSKINMVHNIKDNMTVRKVNLATIKQLPKNESKKENQNNIVETKATHGMEKEEVLTKNAYTNSDSAGIQQKDTANKDVKFMNHNKSTESSDIESLDKDNIDTCETLQSDWNGDELDASNANHSLSSFKNNIKSNIKENDRSKEFLSSSNQSNKKEVLSSSNQLNKHSRTMNSNMVEEGFESKSLKVNTGNDKMDEEESKLTASTLENEKSEKLTKGNNKKTGNNLQSDKNFGMEKNITDVPSPFAKPNAADETRNEIDLEFDSIEKNEKIQQKQMFSQKINNKVNEIKNPSKNLLKTHLVSFKTTDSDGCLVKREQNLGEKIQSNLIDINTVIEEENVAGITNNREPNRTRKSISNKTNSLKNDSKNNNYEEKSTLKPWRREKDVETEDKLKLRTLKTNQRSASASDISMNKNDENLKKKSATNSVVNKDILGEYTPSKSSTNIDINGELNKKPDDNLEAQQSQESKMDSQNKNPSEKSSNTKLSTNTSTHPSQIQNIQRNKVATNQIVKEGEKDFRKPKFGKAQKTSSESKIKVLHQVKTETLKEVKKNYVESKIPPAQKQKLVKEKSQFTLDEVAEKIKQDNLINQMKIQNDVKTSSKADHSVIQKESSKYIITNTVKTSTTESSARTDSVSLANQKKEANLQFKKHSQENEKLLQNNKKEDAVLMNKSNESHANTRKSSQKVEKVANKNINLKENKEKIAVVKDTNVTNKLNKSSKNKSSINLSTKDHNIDTKLIKNKSTIADKKINVLKSNSATELRSSDEKLKMNSPIKEGKKDDKFVGTKNTNATNKLDQTVRNKSSTNVNTKDNKPNIDNLLIKNKSPIGDNKINALKSKSSTELDSNEKLKTNNLIKEEKKYDKIYSDLSANTLFKKVLSKMETDDENELTKSIHEESSGIKDDLILEKELIQNKMKVLLNSFSSTDQKHEADSQNNEIKSKESLKKETDSENNKTKIPNYPLPNNISREMIKKQELSKNDFKTLAQSINRTKTSVRPMPNKRVTLENQTTRVRRIAKIVSNTNSSEKIIIGMKKETISTDHVRNQLKNKEKNAKK